MFWRPWARRLRCCHSRSTNLFWMSFGHVRMEGEGLGCAAWYTCLLWTGEGKREDVSHVGHLRERRGWPCFSCAAASAS